MLIFTKITRPQLLAVTGWSKTDLDNRVHHNHLALAHGLTLPAENGVYIGLDCFALLLSDALAEGGFTRALAGQFVREAHDKWLHGLGRIEWPDLHPPPVPAVWGATKRAIDEGITAFPPDPEIYFAVAKKPNGDFQAACGTQADTIGEFLAVAAAGRVLPVRITHFNLRWVYEVTLAAAQKAGVDLGAPFTRPEKHPEHREWYAAVEVYRALSFARLKVRKPPGPAPRAKRLKGKKTTAAPAPTGRVREAVK